MKTSSYAEESYARIGIVGFGAVGASILAQQVSTIENLIAANPASPPPLVEFSIYNKDRSTGYGQAYDLTKMHFHLNFPVQCKADEYNVPDGMDPTEIGLVGMHMFDGQKCDLIQWLEKRAAGLTEAQRHAAKTIYEKNRADGLSDNQIAYAHPEAYRNYRLTAEGDDRWGAHSYLPRALYREYLSGIFAETCRRVEAINQRLGFEAIRLNPTVEGCVTHIERASDGALILSCDTGDTANPSGILTGTLDSVVIATGHHNGPLFSEDIQRRKSFANTPLSDTEIETALGDRVDNPGAHVTIVGTGASYLDVLRNLDALNYQGQIVAISSDPLDYWPFDPRKSGQAYDIGPFLKAADGLPLADLKALLVKETHNPATLQAGPQNMFAALKGEMQQLRTYLSPPDFAEFEKFFDKLAGTRTAPDSYEVFRKLKDSGQLTFRSARMEGTSYDIGAGVWNTRLKDGTVLTSDILVDCAGLATRVVGRKGEIYDPLIRSMVQDTKVAVADLERGIATCADDCRGQIAFAGVAGANERGIPFTRQLFGKAAGPTLETALYRAAQRRADMPMPMVA